MFSSITLKRNSARGAGQHQQVADVAQQLIGQFGELHTSGERNVKQLQHSIPLPSDHGLHDFDQAFVGCSSEQAVHVSDGNLCSSKRQQLVE